MLSIFPQELSQALWLINFPGTKQGEMLPIFPQELFQVLWFVVEFLRSKPGEMLRIFPITLCYLDSSIDGCQKGKCCPFFPKTFWKVLWHMSSHILRYSDSGKVVPTFPQEPFLVFWLIQMLGSRHGEMPPIFLRSSSSTLTHQMSGCCQICTKNFFK